MMCTAQSYCICGSNAYTGISICKPNAHRGPSTKRVQEFALTLLGQSLEWSSHAAGCCPRISVWHSKPPATPKWTKKALKILPLGLMSFPTEGFIELTNEGHKCFCNISQNTALLLHPLWCWLQRTQGHDSQRSQSQCIYHQLLLLGPRTLDQGEGGVLFSALGAPGQRIPLRSFAESSQQPVSLILSSLIYRQVNWGSDSN